MTSSLVMPASVTLDNFSRNVTDKQLIQVNEAVYRIDRIGDKIDRAVDFVASVYG